jgi:hypothetical protein
MPNIPQFIPTVFYSGIVRIDSPARQSMLVYDHDKKFFLQNRKRKLYLRMRCIGEFGLSIANFNDGPHVWVLVFQLAPSIHMVMPVFVGPSLFNGNDSTDLDTVQILIEMERLNGIDPFEWRAFIQSWNEYKQATDSAVNGCIN